MGRTIQIGISTVSREVVWVAKYSLDPIVNAFINGDNDGTFPAFNTLAYSDSLICMLTGCNRTGEGHQVWCIVKELLHSPLLHIIEIMISIAEKNCVSAIGDLCARVGVICNIDWSKVEDQRWEAMTKLSQCLPQKIIIGDREGRVAPLLGEN